MDNSVLPVDNSLELSTVSTGKKNQTGVLAKLSTGYPQVIHRLSTGYPQAVDNFYFLVSVSPGENWRENGNA